jgi:hypothetical protein
MKIDVKLDKRAAQTLDGFFNHIFNTGASVTFTIDFDSKLFYPTEDNGVIEPEVLIFPQKALIQIK